MTTNHLAAVSTSERGGPPNASAHNRLVSLVPFTLDAPTPVMGDGPTEEQARALDIIMGGGGGGGGGVPPAQDRSGNDMTDNCPPGGEIHTSALGRVSTSPQVQVMGVTLAEDNEDEENKDEGDIHIAPEKEEGEKQDEKVQGQYHNEHEDEHDFLGQMSDTGNDDKDEETIIIPGNAKKTTDSDSDDEHLPDTPAPTIDPNAPRIRVRADHWITVWAQLECTGWKRVMGSGLMTDYFYILPHAAKWWKKSNKGVEGVDYFTRVEDVRCYCAKTYGWDAQPEGSEMTQMKEKADAERKAPRKRKAAADAEATRKAKKAADEQKQLHK
mmetsp:Transcript_38334/g.78159  ORF Transcript_38334/g.78159 Transcript_38334/m.78159 type:complete len:327 (-) Transcript_38334:1706-2686(-)